MSIYSQKHALTSVVYPLYLLIFCVTKCPSICGVAKREYKISYFKLNNAWHTVMNSIKHSGVWNIISKMKEQTS